jgi:hypothetical protein
MTGIFTAMQTSGISGRLDVLGAKGGPQFLADMASGKQTPPCTPLVEAPKDLSGGGLPPPNCSTTRGFDLYVSFLPSDLQANASTPAGIQATFAFCNDPFARLRAGNSERVAIACGENIFDNRPINDPVVGRNTSGNPPSGSFGSTAPPNARCTSCHAASNVGITRRLHPAYTPGGERPEACLFVGARASIGRPLLCRTSDDPSALRRRSISRFPEGPSLASVHAHAEQHKATTS